MYDATQAFSSLQSDSQPIADVGDRCNPDTQPASPQRPRPWPTIDLKPRPLCRHCFEKPVCRPRGLCWCCYHLPGVREQYPSTGKFARRGPGDDFKKRPLPDEPTDARPGSKEKIAVMMARVDRGESVFHPDDARIESPTRPIRRSAVVRWNGYKLSYPE